jgi:hypothetical protein
MQEETSSVTAYFGQKGKAVQSNRVKPGQNSILIDLLMLSSDLTRLWLKSSRETSLIKPNQGKSNQIKPAGRLECPEIGQTMRKKRWRKAGRQAESKPIKPVLLLTCSRYLC